MKKSECIKEEIETFTLSDKKSDVDNLEKSVDALFNLICKIKNIPIALQNKIFSVMAEQIYSSLSFMLDLLDRYM